MQLARKDEIINSRNQICAKEIKKMIENIIVIGLFLIPSLLITGAYLFKTYIKVQAKRGGNR